MRVYFLSSKPCILTLNGAYFGLTDTFERFAELSPKDNLFAQFTPEDGQPIRFFVNESIRFHPPKRCEVYLLKDGLAVYAKDFPSTDMTLRSIAQARENDTLVTVFFQGVPQVSIESPKGFFLAPLSTPFQPCEIRFHGEFILLSSPERISVFLRDGKCVLDERVNEFTLENDLLTAVLPLSDRLNRTAKCSWELTGESVKRTAFSIEQKTNFSVPFEKENAKLDPPTAENIRDEILPYAFFESVLIGANYADLLCENLKEKSTSLKEFLGEFESVVLTEKPNVCGLIRKKADRLFEVDEYRVEIENGKITDILKE